MSSSSIVKTPTAPGSHSYLADKRQLAALLLVTGFAAISQPLELVASTINSADDGTTTPTEGLAFASLFAGLCVITTGVLSVVAGYTDVVHDFGHKYFYGFLIIFSQTAWIKYLTSLIGVGKAAAVGMSFVMGDYGQTDADNNFIAFTGMLGIIAYGFGFLGAVSFFQCALYAFHTGKPQDRNSAYYKGRLPFYSVILFLAGLSQFLLGAYIIARFGSQLNSGPVVVAFYVVHYPGISVFVGLIQIINAVWGLARSRGMLIFGGQNDYSFQVSMALGWFFQLVLQVITQPASLPASAFSANASMAAAYAFGQNLMPAFLDYKARQITPAYYVKWDSEVETEHEAQESDV